MFSKISRFLSISLFALITFSFTLQIKAQVDPTFGTNGVVTADLGTDDATLATFVLPDGKILVVAVALVNNQQKTFFIKYNSNGTPDSGYGTNGILQVPVPFFTPNSAKIGGAARQSDGKIVIVGYDYFNSDQRPLVARFNEDGTIDGTFAGGGGISRPNLSPIGDDRFYSVVIQPDGKILMAGGSEFTSTIYPSLSLVRYNADGTLDTGFGTTGQGFIVHSSSEFRSLEGGEFLYLQSDGKIIVGTLRQVVSNGPLTEGGRIQRFNADGTIDASFTVLTFFEFNELQSVFVQPDDKILVGTRFSNSGPLERSHLDSRINRYHANGSIDTGFGTNGQILLDVASYSDDYPKGFQVMPDGQILVAYNIFIEPNRSIYRNNWLALVRLSATGAVNGKFLAAPTGDNHISFIKTLSDGKILASVRGRTWSGAEGVKLVRAIQVPLQNYTFHSIPYYFPAGSIGAATSIGVYRPSTNRFHFYPSITLNNTSPSPGDVPAAADFLGNYLNEIAYFRPTTGTWHIVRDFWGGSNILTVRWGADGDIPVPADFNGDGKADPAVYRPSNGVWYIYHIIDGSYRIENWGTSGDKPVVGDYDGDGIYDIAIFRPSNGQWWIRRSSDGGSTAITFGLAEDIPVQEDYDGDGKFDVAVYRPSTGIWYRLNSSDGSFFAYQWGLAGDIPVPGNYDNDQKANVAVWRPSNGTWYIVNPDYASMIPYVWGVSGDRPLPAKY